MPCFSRCSSSRIWPGCPGLGACWLPWGIPAFDSLPWLCPASVRASVWPFSGFPARHSPPAPTPVTRPRKWHGFALIFLSAPIPSQPFLLSAGNPPRGRTRAWGWKPCSLLTHPAHCGGGGHVISGFTSSAIYLQRVKETQAEKRGGGDKEWERQRVKMGQRLTGR